MLLLEMSSFAQLAQSNRIEYEQSFLKMDKSLVNLGRNGVLLYDYSIKLNGESRDWEFTHLDTTLNEIWKTRISIDENYEVLNYDTLDNSVFLLLSDQYKRRELIILKIDLENKKFVAQSFSNLVSMYSNQFRVIDDAKKFVIGGYFNERPIVVIYDAITNQPKILPGLLNYKGELVQLSVVNQFNSINILINYLTTKTGGGMWLKSFDFDGNALKNTPLNVPNKFYVKSGKVISLDPEHHLFAGVYGRKNSYYSQGVYFGLLGENSTDFDKLINYSELPNFFRYMRDRRYQRVISRIEKRKAEGKKTRFNYRVIVHDIVLKDSVVLMLGESHSVDYKQQSGYSSPFGLQSSRTNSGYVFDGYRYTHGFILAINSAGEIIWDVSIKTSNIKKYDLEQVVNFTYNKSGSVLFYPERDILKYLEYFPGSTEYNEKEEKIALSYSGDIVRNSTNEPKVVKWYGNNYLIYGTQWIKNFEDAGVKLNREVFFINKIHYSSVFP